MNKKLFAIGLVAIMLATVFVGCKKGENDPALSLASRKARISGVWNLTSANYTQVEVDNKAETTTTIYSYDGTNMTETENGEGVTYPYSEKITINKDGSFKSEINETHTYENWNGDTYTTVSTLTYEGLWYFVDGNKTLDVKNKERVEFLIEKQVSSYTSGGDTYSSTTEYSGKSNTFNMLLLLEALLLKNVGNKF